MKSAVNDGIFGKYKFLIDPTFARHPELPDSEPCYRLIICHAFFAWFKNNGHDIQKMEDELNKLNRCYSSSTSQTNCIYYLASYLEIYMYKFNNGENGYSLVDKSGGIYPLFCYPYSNSSYLDEPAKERSRAFRAAIDAVAYKNKREIREAFKRNSEWESLQSELKFILHKENKKAA